MDKVPFLWYLKTEDWWCVCEQYTAEFEVESW